MKPTIYFHCLDKSSILFVDGIWNRQAIGVLCSQKLKYNARNYLQHSV